TITRNGNTTQGSFSPYGENWSNYFDGTGDYLSLATNAAFGYGTGAFTIEGWFNTQAIPAAGADYLFDQRTTGVQAAVLVYISTSAGLEVFVNGATVIAGGTVVVNTWNHFALTKSGTTTRLFLNGVQVGSNYTDNNNYGTTAPMVIASRFTAEDFYQGYISNFRVIKGTALYTANFTPNTVPLQPIAGTSLLTCKDPNIVDDSANQFAITRNGNVSVQKFAPFAGTTLTTPYFSGYFDGNGDDLSAPSNAAFTYETGDFCIEGWFYFTGGVGGSGYSYIFAQGASTGAASLGMYIQDGVYKVWNGSAVITSATGFVQGSWVHLALTRSGTTMRLFVNGVQSGSATNSSNITTGSTIGISIGRWAEISDSNYITGYVSNFRVVKGTAIYTANFTPPTAPLTAISGTSLLTCQSNTFVDNSTNNFTLTAVGNTRPTTFAPFAVTYSSLQSYTPAVFGGSMYFDGTGDFLTLPISTALGPTTGDYTWEAWIYPATLGSNKVFYASSQSSGSLVIGVGNSTANRLTVFRNGIAFDFIGTTDMSVYLNSWVHIAVTKLSGTTKFWINGVNTDTFTTNVTYVAGGTAASVGRRIAVSEDYTGSISNMRLVKGTALYTSNFAPQNSPLTAVTNTSLLLGATNAGIYDAATLNTFETVGNAQVSTSVKKYGVSSMAFDGSGDSLDVRPLALPFFSQRGAYTIELWIYPTNLSVAQYFYSQVPTNFLQLAISSSGFLQVDRSGVGVAITSSSALTINTWQYVTLVSDGTNLRLYINGTQSGSTASVGTQVNPSSEIIRIGAYQNNGGAPSFPFYGYIQDFRITQGIARYTSTFTPPTAALPTF
ncbi:LamG domain-containing protein, partial [Limnohabitans sp.]|uniref:LamG domain-containing protein n=1 Tax=Limnohabitans sp. TaxID=1907725 RepID=UPI003342B501